MATLTISVPAATKNWVDEQVKSGGYDDANAFMADLLESERLRSEAYDNDKLRQIVEDSLASGVSSRSIDEIFAGAVERVRAQGKLRD